MHRRKLQVDELIYNTHLRPNFSLFHRLIMKILVKEYNFSIKK